MKMLILMTGLIFSIDSQNYAQAEWDSLGLSSAGDIMDLAIDGDGYIYAGVQGGVIYRSTDNGISWELKNNGISAGIGSKIEVYKNQIYLATDNGLYKSIDCGENWIRIAQSIEYLDFIDIKVLPNGYFFTSVSNQLAFGGVYRSTDNGETWLPTSFTGYGAMDIGMNSNGVMFFCNGTAWWRAIYRSFDLGMTWERIWPWLPTYSLAYIKGSIVLAGLLPDPNTGGLYESTDNGNSWFNTLNFYEDNLICDFVVDTNNDIYLSAWGSNSGGQQGVYLSTDNGSSWNFIGLPNDFVNCLAIDSSGYLYAGTHVTGIFRTPGRTVPVELTSFRADVKDGSVVLNWTTATETNNKGFEVEKQVSSKQPDEVEVSPKGGKSVSSQWEEIGFVAGYGTTTEPKSYSFTDNDLKNGTYSYRLKQIDFDGSFKYSNVIEVTVNVPLKYSLEQNYPNPFNPATVIEYQIPVDSRVTIKVFDVLGREVKTLVDENKSAGKHKINFEAGRLSNGIYYYRLTSGNFVQTKKMIVLK